MILVGYIYCFRMVARMRVFMGVRMLECIMVVQMIIQESSDNDAMIVRNRILGESRLKEAVCAQRERFLEMIGLK